MFKISLNHYTRSEVESQTKTSKDSKDSKDTVAIVPQSTVLHLPSSNIKVEMEVLDHLFKKTSDNPGKQQPNSGSCFEGSKGVGSTNNNGLHTSSSPSSQFASLMSAKPAAPASIASKSKPRYVILIKMHLIMEISHSEI